jgi:hypothetical protein
LFRQKVRPKGKLVLDQGRRGNRHINTHWRPTGANQKQRPFKLQLEVLQGLLQDVSHSAFGGQAALNDPGEVH